MYSKHKSTNATTLRNAAEQMATWAIAHPMHDETDARKLLHELQVHQIELEMQNAELNLAQVESDKKLKNMTDINQRLKEAMDQGTASESVDQYIRRGALAKMSNEMAEPLKVIAQMSQQIIESKANPQLVEQLDKLEKAGQQMQSIINSYKQFT